MILYRVVLAAHVLFSAGSFDSGMSTLEKKNTGVNKLTDAEKTALQQWIDKNYQKKISQEESHPVQQVRGISPTLSENLLNSQYLRLSDGSLWNVRTEDVPIAKSWITPVEIIVGKSSDPFFPYTLTNKVSGTSILVRKAEKLPQAGSPPLSPKS